MNPNAKLMRPPVPILQNEGNWPLLAVSKTLFETKGGLKGIQIRIFVYVLAALRSQDLCCIDIHLELEKAFSLSTCLENLLII